MTFTAKSQNVSDSVRCFTLEELREMEKIFIECDYFKKEINNAVKKNTILKDSNKILSDNNSLLKNENKVLNEKLNEQSLQLVKLKQNRILWAGAGILTGAIIISIIK